MIDNGVIKNHCSRVLTTDYHVIAVSHSNDRDDSCSTLFSKSCKQALDIREANSMAGHLHTKRMSSLTINSRISDFIRVIAANVVSLRYRSVMLFTIGSKRVNEFVKSAIAMIDFFAPIKTRAIFAFAFEHRRT
jgi:hypothetical protein